MKRDRILFLSSKNPFSKKEWSGIPFHMFQALSHEYEVEYVALPSLNFAKSCGYHLARIFAKLSKKKYAFDYGVAMAWLYGQWGSFLLQGKKDVKFIFSPSGLTETAYLQTSIPIVSFGDCSTLQLVDYYPAMTGISNFSKVEITYVERRALAGIALAMFSSEWARSFVQAKFDVKQCFVVPFGSNIQNETNAKPKSLYKNRCNLLFVGTDWIRKGGDVALQIHKKLMSKGIPSHLTIIGSCIPPDASPGKNVRVIEYLDKNNEEGEMLYKQILGESDFFILPSLADCTPIVIGEAFSFGVPVLATCTGGIPSMVFNNITGFLLKQGDVEGYVKIIVELSRDMPGYQKLSENCLGYAQTIFNWSSWAKSFKNNISTSIG